MRYLVFSMIMMCFFLKTTYTAVVEAHGYRAAYESAREQLEGYKRTKARHIDNAYVCKSKR